jgi:geranylgeranyl pyrophosphate synthase
MDGLAILEQQSARVEQQLRDSMDHLSCPEGIKAAMSYSLLAGGKRIRPAMLLLTCRMLQGDEQTALPLALSLEMIHTYSLIHDDLPALDNDALRRGKPTCHMVYGEDQAIVAGDALLNLAYENMLAFLPMGGERRDDYLDAMALIAEAAGAKGMCGGQHLDLLHTGEFSDMEGLRQMHLLKTGALLRAAVLSGAKVAHADGETLAALGDFAAAYGLLFQITDDILDTVGDAQTLGKSAGKDALEGKTTYVTLLGLEAARQRAQEAYAAAQAALSRLDADSSWFQWLLDFTIGRNH